MNGPVDHDYLDSLAQLGEPIERVAWSNGHDATPPPRPKFKTLAEFFGEFEPPSYTIEGLLRSASLYTLTARTGHGKTAFLIAAMLAIGTGRLDILGIEPTRGRVAYLTFENPDDVRARMMVATYLLNIDATEIIDDVLILDMRHKPEEVHIELRRLAAERPFALVIVDTLAAMFDGDDANSATQAGEFMRRLRPITKIEGKPTVVVAAHPVKNASEDNLIPYGSGAVLNEVDGNLTLWKSPETGLASLYWQGKLRGREFEPLTLRFDEASSPDVIDAKGREILLPVMRPCDAESVKRRDEASAATDLALVQAMLADPGGTQEAWGQAIGRTKARVNIRLHNLERRKLVKAVIGGKWQVTPKGQKEAEQALAEPGK